MKQLFSIFLLLSLLGKIYSQSQNKQLEEELNKIIHYDAQIDFSRTTGFVVGIIHGDSMYIYGYGSTGKDTLNVPDGNTIFEIGGVTKVFTATLVDILEKKGMIDYEETLNSYFNSAAQNEQLANISVLSLVTHTSGLPKLPLHFGIKEKRTKNPFAHYTKQDLLQSYKSFTPIEYEYGKYRYSHLNYALLEVLLEKQTQQSIDKLMLENILNPLGMNDSRFILDDSQSGRLASGYTPGGRAVSPWLFQSFKGALGLKSTPNDMLRFMKAQMGMTSSDLMSTFSDTQQAIYKTELDKKSYIGKGWHIIRQKKYYDIIAYIGATAGYRCHISFVKETQTGVVVLSNSPLGLGNLGYTTLKMLNNHWKKKK